MWCPDMGTLLSSGLHIWPSVVTSPYNPCRWEGKQEYRKFQRNVCRPDALLLLCAPNQAGFCHLCGDRIVLVLHKAEESGKILIFLPPQRRQSGGCLYPNEALFISAFLINI